MKFSPAIYVILFLSFIFSTGVFAQGIENSFVVWLLNNEAKFMSILSQDRQIIRKMEMPLGMLSERIIRDPMPEQKLWRTHLKFYSTCRELGKIYSMINRLGSGNLTKNLERTHPGYVSTRVFIGNPSFMAQSIAAQLEKIFKEGCLKSFGIEKLEDADLYDKLDKTMKQISFGERRLFIHYLDNFNALYPTDKPSKILAALVKGGLKKDVTNKFAASVGELLAKTASATTVATSNDVSVSSGGVAESPDESTAENGKSEHELSNLLETYTSTASETDAASGTPAATSPEEVDDPFKILN